MVIKMITITTILIIMITIIYENQVCNLVDNNPY
jgi:hypothetical protein